MTSRLRKKPPITAPTFLATAASTGTNRSLWLRALWCQRPACDEQPGRLHHQRFEPGNRVRSHRHTGALTRTILRSSLLTILLAGYATLAGAQTVGTGPRSQAAVNASQANKAVWSTDRAPRSISQGRAARPTRRPTTAKSGRMLSSPGWTTPKTMADTSEHLNWRAPHDRSQETPRRLKPNNTRAIHKPLVTRNRGQDAPRSRVVLASHLEDIDRTTSVLVRKDQAAPAAPSPGQVRPRPRAGADLKAFQDRTRAVPSMTLNRPTGRLAQADTPPFDEAEAAPSPEADPLPDESIANLFAQPPTRDEDPQDDESDANLFAQPPTRDEDPLDEDPPTIKPPADLDRWILASESNANVPREVDPLPPPMDNPDLPNAFDEVETPEFNILRDDVGNDRIDSVLSNQLSGFSNQDCDSQSAACRDDFARLAVRQQTNMSIDITPSIKPRELDMAKVDEERERKLAKAPSRTWRDRQGTVLAEGSLSDYRNGKIYIRTLNGTLRDFLPSSISDEDWCFVTSWWELPPECRFDDEPFQMRNFRLTTFTWTAPSTCHKPLYFEEVQLERYGHSAGPIVQPFLSGAHFFGSALMLPYQIGLNPPNECESALGYYRPGDCAPWLVHGYPITTRGVTWQGLALGAAISLFP